MDQTATIKPQGLAQDEKITPVMIYTQNMLIRGNAITKESVRVSIWLRTMGAPEYIRIRNAQIVILGGNGPLQSVSLSDYLVPTLQVLAFHMLPPSKDPVDYDETEKNRKMEPMTFLVGTFRMNASIRMSSNSDIATFLTIIKTTFLSIYELDISNPCLPSMGTMHVPMALIRPAMASFGLK